MGKVAKYYYEKEIKHLYDRLVYHPLSKEIGDHNRIDVWDFWWTGTVRNIKTGEQINYQELLNKYPI